MKNIHRVSTAGMSRADWLAERRKSLGGSDMGAVLGLNTYSSPYSVWAEKTGRIPDKEDTEAMRIGRDLEDYVCRRFMEASGLKVQKCNAILRNDRYPHLHANVDRLIVGQKAGVEAKTASALNASSFTGGEFPASYYAQCVAYLAVTEYERWYLAALVMGREFHIYQMTRIQDDTCPDWCDSSVFVSEEEITALAEEARRFWEENVEKDEPPAVDGDESTTKALQTIYEESSGRTIEIWSADVKAAVRAYLKLKAEEKERRKLLEEQANIIREYLGEAEGAECELAKVSWKPQSRESFDRKRFSKEHPDINLTNYITITNSRVFKVTEKKGA